MNLLIGSVVPKPFIKWWELFLANNIEVICFVTPYKGFCWFPIAPEWSDILLNCPLLSLSLQGTKEMLENDKMDQGELLVDDQRQGEGYIVPFLKAVILKD